MDLDKTIKAQPKVVSSISARRIRNSVFRPAAGTGTWSKAVFLSPDAPPPKYPARKAIPFTRGKQVHGFSEDKEKQIQ
jgi:hypothetical protein